LGVTYKAYLDVLIARNDLWYCTVDTDCGCGIIRLNQKARHYKRAIDGDEACIQAWRNVRDNYDAAFQIYERHRDALMNVVPVDEFLIAEIASLRAKLLLNPGRVKLLLNLDRRSTLRLLRGYFGQPQRKARIGW
jgi:hypothetical protein